MPSRETRREHNQLLFRRANERMHEALEEETSPMRAVPFLCECAAEDCFGTVEVTLAEWEDVASTPNQFLMEAGHQRSEGEEIVGVLREYELARKPD
jgi:hypothetical protein